MIEQRAIEPIDRVVPPIQRRDRRRRRGDRPFPQVNEGEEPEPPSETEDRESKPPSEDPDERHIDVVVRGRLLPTRQILPDCPESRTLH